MIQSKILLIFTFIIAVMSGDIVYNLTVLRKRTPSRQGAVSDLDLRSHSVSHVLLMSMTPVGRKLFSASITWPVIGIKRTLLLLGLHQPWWNSLDKYKLVLGALPLPNDIETLIKKHHVTAVVNTCAEFSGYSTRYAKHNIIQHYLPIVDACAPSVDALKKATAFIHQHVSTDESRCVYIHCRAGRGRSVTVVLAYLMEYHGLTREQAQLYVNANRSVSKNVYQRPIIVEYEKYLKSQTIK